MTKKATKKAATKATKEAATLTKEQKHAVNGLVTNSRELAKALSEVFTSTKLTPKQKREVKAQTIDVVAGSYKSWREEYKADKESRAEERGQARLDRIAAKRERLAERRRKMDEAEAKLAAAESKLTS